MLRQAVGCSNNDEDKDNFPMYNLFGQLLMLGLTIHVHVSV